MYGNFVLSDQNSLWRFPSEITTLTTHSIAQVSESKGEAKQEFRRKVEVVRSNIPTFQHANQLDEQLITHIWSLRIVRSHETDNSFYKEDYKRLE